MHRAAHQRPYSVLLFAGALLALLLAPIHATCEEQAAPQASAARQLENPATDPNAAGHPSPAPTRPEANTGALPPVSVTEHSLTLAGATLNYTAETGSLPLHDADGKTTAEIFYVAYWREPRDAKRPVTFIFNGGPGAASAYLHLGAIGPRILETSPQGEIEGPPPHLVDNDSTWLATTDLVFVDPVGTGYSHAANSKDEAKFWGVDQDAESLSDFVRLYLTHAGRMISPVFLVGESYGGIRVGTLARKLQKTGGISPSGLILISPALEFSLLNGEDYDPLSWALPLASFAAVNLEQKGTTTRTALAEALQPVQHYALADYLVALAEGSEQGGKLASERVAELTGLPLPLVQQHLARISTSLFIKEFDRSHGQVLSRYDGTVSGPDPNPSSAFPEGPDPVLDSTAPLWTAAFVQYAQAELNYKTDANYRLLNRDVRAKWDFGTTPTRQGYAGVMDDIQEARALNPKLAIFIATGYTDLITPYTIASYLVGQLAPLPGATPITVETYLGGHMLYLRPDSRRALKDDVEALYARMLKASPEG